MSFTFKSKESLDKEKKNFVPLLAEDYELVIVKLEEAVQAKYQAVADENGKIPMENILNIQFEIIAFKDGDPAVDVNGAPAHGRKIFFTGRPDSMGFMKDGSPAKLRALVAYATNQDVNGDIVLGSWNELVGKQVYAEIVEHTSQKGNKGNKISRFLPKRSRPKVQVQEDDIPIIESEEVNVADIPF